MSDSNITKQALADSLKNLMSKVPFHKINVCDIVENCGLTRQAFYYHFKDKYDLMNWIYYTEAARFMANYTSAENWTDGLINLCYYMQDNSSFYINALNTTGQNSFPEYLQNYISAITMSILESSRQRDFDKENLKFVVEFFAAAFTWLIIKWANNGMKEDPADYISKIQSIFDGTLFHKFLDENESKK